MTDIIDPKRHPQLAAQQLVVELIRTSMVEGTHEVMAMRIMEIYDMFEKHFTEKYPQTQGGIY